MSPAEHRPRERLLREGPAALAVPELLAVLLDTGTRERMASSASPARLLRDFGGLKGLCEAEPGALLGVPGLGPAKVARLLAALALSRRYLEERLVRSGPVEGPEAAAELLVARLRGREREVVVGLFLDQRHRVLACEDLAQGTIHEAIVHPREVVRACLRHNAAALIVAHNHPSGVAEPSPADCALTRRLREALALIEVRLLDHLIVGEGAPVSLARRGLL
ncbi:MAG: DNA repair protein RadC [Xanthomonadales bacterium]|nr:DNA repair protein RadC [Xanthomonadales bacterium]